MLNAEIYRKIPELTPGQKKVAEYVCGNRERVVYQTIAQIAKESGVSETTVIRFSYAMGFSSFSDMLSSLQKEQLRAGGSLAAGNDGYTGEENDYQAILRNDIAELQQLEHQLDYEGIDKAARILADAELVYSIGFRNSSFAANWFANTAQVLRPNVRCLSSMNYSYSPVIDANGSSAAIVLLYSRYSTQTVMFANHIKNSGGKLIVITDSLTAPLTDKAEHVFIAPPNRMVAQFNCTLTAFTLLNMLLQGITKYRPDYVQRLNTQDALIASTNQMIE